MNTLKANKTAIIIVIVTLVLAGIAVFTAIRLYQLRQNPVAPNVPGSTPAAAEGDTVISCQTVSFTLAESPTPSASATPTTTAKATATPTPTVTNPPVGGALTPTPTVKPTATPIAQTTLPPVVVTPAPSLPEAGVATPTVIGVVAAIALLTGAIVLAK